MCTSLTATVVVVTSQHRPSFNSRSIRDRRKSDRPSYCRIINYLRLPIMLDVWQRKYYYYRYIIYRAVMEKTTGRMGRCSRKT